EQNKGPCKVKDCDNNNVTQVINDKWKNITIDIANDEVILNKDDFIKLINRTNQLEIFQAEIKI
ncbi:1384_t:CDS:2, partial [Dentiscutata heterogama]